MSQNVNYVADAPLRAAVDVALELQMPLLVTGEPGTGKTQLAYWVARELLGTDVLRFNTKTTSTARDLFYRYDAIRHFRDAQREDVNPLDYVTFEALGLAILASAEKQLVVLVDEIDKAPRDFPNDLLYEFEELAFRIEEARPTDFDQYEFSTHAELQRSGLSGKEILPDAQGFLRHAPQADKPVLILTSNSEKNLPDAFMRRCVFYHIPFPQPRVLAEIVRKNVVLDAPYAELLDSLVQKFLTYRGLGLRKNPATAELIRWVEILQRRGIDPDTLDVAGAREQLLATMPVLAKNKEDLEKLQSA